MLRNFLSVRISFNLYVQMNSFIIKIFKKKNTARHTGVCLYNIMKYRYYRTIINRINTHYFMIFINVGGK